MMDELRVETPAALSADDLECKICFCTYGLSIHRPKVLACRHRLCSGCLAKLLDVRESRPTGVVCPFCRYVTGLHGDSVSSGLLDDSNLLTALSVIKTDQLNETPGEIVLSPRCLTSFVGHSVSPPSVCSNYVVITILGSQEPAYSGSNGSSSSDSVWNCTTLLCWASARVLVWFLGLLYFSSLPLGIYLLVIQKTTLGALLLGLVPVSLLAIMLCVIQEFFDCVPP